MTRDFDRELRAAERVLRTLPYVPKVKERRGDELVLVYADVARGRGKKSTTVLLDAHEIAVAVRTKLIHAKVSAISYGNWVKVHLLAPHEPPERHPARIKRASPLHSRRVLSH